VARYDRIARLEAPSRASAFEGWLAMRDVDGREREGEFGRRARLRFLALRPVRRLLARGFDGVDGASLDRQLEGVREELGHLPSRDSERRLLADFLREIEARDPDRLTLATLAVGDAAGSAGHGYAAEEFYRTGLELAESLQLPGPRLRALRSLGWLYGKRGSWREATEQFEAAAAAADEKRDGLSWGEAVSGLAIIQGRAGDAAAGRAGLARVVERGEREQDDRLVAIAAAAECALELAAGRAEAAVEAGWRAVELLAPSDEARTAALLDLAEGFRRLRLREPSEACYRLVLRSAPWADHGARAQLGLTVSAAEAGDPSAFDERRRSLLDSMDEGHARLTADIHVGLARAAMLVDDVDGARAHLREAMTTARKGGLGDAALVAEDLLAGLERLADTALRAETTTPSPGVRTIAQRVESLGGARLATG
jgi:tetratricopeptide (TPR) repeat protein